MLTQLREVALLITQVTARVRAAQRAMYDQLLKILCCDHNMSHHVISTNEGFVAWKTDGCSDHMTIILATSTNQSVHS